MAFYDNFSKKIQRTGQDAIEKTKKTAETVKINAAFSDLEKEIQSVYTKLGKAYYEKYAAQPEDEDLISYFRDIEKCMEQIEEYQNKIADLKGLVRCANCGMSVSAEAAFCNHCGARIVPKANVSEADVSDTAGADTAGADTVSAESGEPGGDASVDQIESAEGTEKTSVRCPVCGSEQEPGTAFCTTCGFKMN